MARRPTIEWQVCGICNYDCSYCIQSKKHRVGQPSRPEMERFLAFFAALEGRWEIKVSGGEPFASSRFMSQVVPGLMDRTAHTLSVLTNLSASISTLERFAALTRGRLGIVSASLHPEHVDLAEFVARARTLRQVIDPQARMVINAVLRPGRLEEAAAAKDAVEGAGLRFFPQIMKVKGGIYDYDEGDQRLIAQLTGRSPGPREANMAPSYRGRMCWCGADYFVLTQGGQGWSCRTAKRFGEGDLGNVLAGSFRLREAPTSCSYGICPCTVPANRGMIEGVGDPPAQEASRT